MYNTKLSKKEIITLVSNESNDTYEYNQFESAHKVLCYRTTLCNAIRTIYHTCTVIDVLEGIGLQLDGSKLKQNGKDINIGNQLYSVLSESYGSIISQCGIFAEDDDTIDKINNAIDLIVNNMKTSDDLSTDYIVSQINQYLKKYMDYEHSAAWQTFIKM